MTLARSATNTVAGIRPIGSLGFIVAQLAGAATATVLFCWLYQAAPATVAVVRAATSSGRRPIMCSIWKRLVDLTYALGELENREAGIFNSISPIDKTRKHYSRVGRNVGRISSIKKALEKSRA